MWKQNKEKEYKIDPKIYSKSHLLILKLEFMKVNKI